MEALLPYPFFREQENSEKSYFTAGQGSFLCFLIRRGEYGKSLMEELSNDKHDTLLRHFENAFSSVETFPETF